MCGEASRDCSSSRIKICFSPFSAEQPGLMIGGKEGPWGKCLNPVYCKTLYYLEMNVEAVSVSLLHI